MQTWSSSKQSRAKRREWGEVKAMSQLSRTNHTIHDAIRNLLKTSL
jgi:hypothetical protein